MPTEETGLLSPLAVFPPSVLGSKLALESVGSSLLVSLPACGAESGGWLDGSGQKYISQPTKQGQFNHILLL